MITLVRTRSELAAARDALSGRVAVVMTMGALHRGHGALIDHARGLADHVITTVFVNPLQFGAGEDLDRYPRQLEADLALCQAHGVDVAFAPTVDEIYPGGTPTVTVSAGWMGTILEGTDRPGHFDGVLTVVLKLLHLTRPDLAVYGEKDGQQLALIKAMARDLDLGVEIVGAPTVREEDGLALSSRNVYLSETERRDALALSRGLAAGAARAVDGADAVLADARESLAKAPGIVLSYVALVDDATWQPAGPQTSAARLLVAAKVGTTRLIDNRIIRLG